MEVKEAIKIAQTIVNNHNAMTGLINCDVEAIQTLIDHATHPQREALDEEKLTKLAYSVNKIFTEREEIPVAMRKFIDLIVKNFATPSLEDLLSALPEKMEVTDICCCDCVPCKTDTCARCQLPIEYGGMNSLCKEGDNSEYVIPYNAAIDDCIAALKERSK